MIFTCNQLPAKADFYSYKIHANNLENDLLFHEMVEDIKLPFLGIMNVGTKRSLSRKWFCAITKSIGI